MARIDAAGNVQLDQDDILPREVAHRTDDPEEVTILIEKLNPTIVTVEDLAAAIEQVDALRRKLSKTDSPYIT